MKGMLTGPVTSLNWSFVRDDQPHSVTCRQIAFAIRDEVVDLEKAGAAIIQIDEAALREGLPLRQGEWQAISTGRSNASGNIVGGGRCNADPHPHVLRGVQRHHRLDSGDGCRRHLHRDGPLADGTLWVNPDCGLKTRQWPEVRLAVENMVAAAQAVRAYG